MRAILFSLAVGLLATVMTGVGLTVGPGVIEWLMTLTTLSEVDLYICLFAGICVSVGTYWMLDRLASQHPIRT